MKAENTYITKMIFCTFYRSAYCSMRFVVDIFVLEKGFV